MTTVTTSTTEAELLALEFTVKKIIYISRLLKSLEEGWESQEVLIYCDNKQTIQLVTAELLTLQTKLQYVDIHHHWL
jgi:hypothetical protein